ncbi:hypothetical protein Q067_02328 [Pseudomonas aeruginosa BL13]|nr:hypothetical protein Q067_02328 [Pseudomonas aeruginosa BL13]
MVARTDSLGRAQSGCSRRVDDLGVHRGNPKVQCEPALSAFIEDMGSAGVVFNVQAYMSSPRLPRGSQELVL